jgi:NADH-quinone oxidoreductase subunit J
MNVAFYTAGAIAIVSTVMVITRLNAVHALLYLIVSLLAVALVFFTLGAPFVAALEVIIYAGAIMVLFVFVMMMLNLGPQAVDQERQWFTPRVWGGPAVLAAILLAELAFVLVQVEKPSIGIASVGPQEVGGALFGPYFLGVELASMLLLAGLVGTYRLGWRDKPEVGEKGEG